MEEYTKEQINEMRELLAESEFEGLRDKGFGFIRAWINIPDEDVISHYGEVVGFDVLED